MKSYIWVTFAVLGLGYYELSDGSAFEAGTNGLQVFAEVEPLATVELPVTRLAMIDTTSVAPLGNMISQPDQAALESAVLTVLKTAIAPVEVADNVGERVARTFPAGETGAEATDGLSGPDLRLINASRVNLRVGPGEGFGVVAKLGSGTAVQVLDDPGDGWVHLRILPQGRMGWVADFLLDDA